MNKTPFYCWDKYKKTALFQFHTNFAQSVFIYDSNLISETKNNHLVVEYVKLKSLNAIGGKNDFIAIYYYVNFFNAIKNKIIKGWLQLFMLVFIFIV